MKAYKVFKRNEKGRLTSAGELPQYLVQVYRKSGRRNLPKFGKGVFVFKEIAAANYFFGSKNSGRNLELWEVYVPSIQSVEKLPRVWNLSRCNGTIDDISYSQDTVLYGLSKFWEDGSDVIPIAGTYDGAYCAPSVTLIKEIKI